MYFCFLIEFVGRSDTAEWTVHRFAGSDDHDSVLHAARGLLDAACGTPEIRVKGPGMGSLTYPSGDFVIYQITPVVKVGDRCFRLEEINLQGAGKESRP